MALLFFDINLLLLKKLICYGKVSNDGALYTSATTFVNKLFAKNISFFHLFRYHSFQQHG